MSRKRTPKTVRSISFHRRWPCVLEVFQRHSVTAQAFYHVAALDAIGKSPLGLDNWLRSGCVFINISIVFEYVLSASTLRSHQNTKILVSISRSGSADGGTVSALSKLNKRAAVAGVGMSADAAR